MNWDGINEFIAVYETTSFTATAKQLDCSTAHVSRTISVLEKRLGTKLFYRTTRKVSPTDAATIYYQHCRQIADALKEAELALNRLQTSPKGILTITAPVAFGESHIAPLLNDFIQQYPDLELRCQLTNQALDLVADGYDLAIRIGRLCNSSMMAR